MKTKQPQPMQPGTTEVITITEETEFQSIILPKGVYWLTRLGPVDPDALIKAAGAVS